MNNFRIGHGWAVVKNFRVKSRYTDRICIFARIKSKTMDTKLTLKLDKLVIEQAKEYASSNKRSLSRIIETYLKSLINQDKKNAEDNQ